MSESPVYVPETGYPELVVLPSEGGSVPEDDYVEDLNDLSEVLRDELRNEVKITRPVMTKYEKAKILGIRASQISRNAKVWVEVPNGVFDSLEIAEQELRERKIPFVVRRVLPDGRFEDFKVMDLAIEE